MSNSPLVSVTKYSPNHSSTRKHAIDRITPHCVVGQLSAESICGLFTSPSRKASCNYAIGTAGEIGLCVDEENRSWCSSSAANDQRAVTIECASDKTDPYAMNGAVYNSLVALCADICQRNGKTKLLWLGDKGKTLAYRPKANEMVLTVHRWFANKSCPGPWLYDRLDKLAEAVNEKLKPEQQPQEQKTVQLTLPVLKKGEKGEEVKALQTLLLGYGYEMKSTGGKVYGADGSFGGATDRAVRKYQKDHGLAVDGSVGRATWSSLLGIY